MGIHVTDASRWMVLRPGLGRPPAHAPARPRPCSAAARPHRYSNHLGLRRAARPGLGPGQARRETLHRQRCLPARPRPRPPPAALLRRRHIYIYIYIYICVVIGVTCWHHFRILTCVGWAPDVGGCCCRFPAAAAALIQTEGASIYIYIYVYVYIYSGRQIEREGERATHTHTHTHSRTHTLATPTHTIHMAPPSGPRRLEHQNNLFNKFKKVSWSRNRGFPYGSGPYFACAKLHTFLMVSACALV